MRTCTIETRRAQGRRYQQVNFSGVRTVKKLIFPSHFMWLTLTMAPKCIGGCAGLFFLGVAFDIIGFAVLLIGIFANLRLDGRFYGDFLIYTGSIIVFLSLIWWIMWYSGNITVSSGDRERVSFDNFAHWARKLSEGLSKSGVKTLEAGECIGNGKKSMKGDVTPHAPTRITWENLGTPGCVNEAYDRSLDAQTNEKTVELEILKNSEVMVLQSTAKGKAERFF
ncbi:Transmembrane protein 238 [Triplophysa tibetana]|uniref:Transmembrane protein 238 n=1 Tax=Triplophysa tibetana TaxID=1572043 RepID=A0A5A9PXY5_9TELE|nr:Transmembrane protein 238 [Triplophysa tibetana]